MKMESEWIEYKIDSEIYDDYDEENISHFEVRGILENAFRDWNLHPDEGPYSPEPILNWVMNCVERNLALRAQRKADESDEE
tara:strand:- start:5529 stop:5774 length:246 start_codon:yes stop_codon:yes gene_type:complete